MSSGPSANRCLQFDNLALDLETDELWKDGELVKLQAQPFKVLVLLAGRAGRVVTREEIQREIWSGDTFVDFDKGIYYCIKEIRSALQDDTEHPRYVETVPKRGYRFLPSPVPTKKRAFEREEAACPYPGLFPFSEADAEFFFGREEEVESLFRKIERRHLLALIGPSGSGKTSLIRAGLIPALPEDWDARVCRPGQAPFEALSEALDPEHPFPVGDLDAAISALETWRGQHAEALLVVDQFEELFTMSNEDVQSRFSEFLGRAAQEVGVRVLLSFRDDFLLRCHDFVEMDPIFQDLTPLKPPKGGALRRALVEAAARCGYRFESEPLVVEILTEVSRERGALPLLAFAAARLWEKRDRESKLLTREAYLEVGGVGGALAQHAEATLDRLGTERLPLVRELFRNLATPQGTRASRKMEDLLSVFPDRESSREVIQLFIDARLLTSFELSSGEGDGEERHRVEIIHESLLSAWPRLVRWQTQDQEGAQLREELRQAAQLWEQHGRSTDRLWTGTAVKEFRLWRERYPGGLTTTEEAFAQATVYHAGRRRRRKRFAVATVITLLIGGSSITTALWRRSVEETRRAEASKLLALGQAEIERYPTAAVAYALKSLELADTLEARLFALRALQRGPTAHIAPIEDALAHRLDFSSDGEWLAVGGYERVQLRKRDGSPPEWITEYPPAGAIGVELDREGHRLITNQRGDIRAWSIPDGKELWRHRLERGPSVSLVGDTHFFTLTNLDAETIVHAWTWDGNEPRQVGTMERIESAASSADMDPTGTWLAYPRGRRIYSRSLEDWSRAPKIIGVHEQNVAEVRFHPDGNRIVSSDTSGQIRIWSLLKGSNLPLRSFDGEGLRWLALDPKGSRLAAYGKLEGKHILRLWDLNAPPGSVPIVVKSNALFRNGTVFDPSDEWLVTADANNISFWTLGDGYPYVLKGHDGRVDDVTFTPDGEWLVSSSGDDTVRLWPLREQYQESRIVFRGNFWFPQLDMDPTGESVLVSGNAGKVFLVPLDTKAPARELTGFPDSAAMWPVAFDLHGRLAAAAPDVAPPEEGVIRIWNLESGDVQVLGPIDQEQSGLQWFHGLEFTPDGQLWSIGSDGLRIWDLEGGASRLIVPVVGNAGKRLAVSRDGAHAVASFGDRSEGQFRSGLVSATLRDGARRLTSHGGKVCSLALDHTDKFVVTGDDEGVVRVGPVTGEEPHVLFGHEGYVRAVEFSPDGHWIASASDDRTIRLWPMPEGPPFHTLPYEEILERLRSVTNLRVIEDETSSAGYRLDVAPFPGWETVPEW